MNALIPTKAAEIMEAVIARGDISKLTAKERGQYYVRVCESIGLNPMTRPFEYITLNNKLTLYARKDCTDQLRSMHKVSVTELANDERDGVFIVTAKVRDNDGRTDIATGAVSIAGLKGEAAANAMMKAETKAKRRATLSICGLGFLDETEIEDIPAAEKSAQTGTSRPNENVPLAPARPKPPNPNAQPAADSDVALVEAGHDDGSTVTWEDDSAGDGIPDNLRRADPKKTALLKQIVELGSVELGQLLVNSDFYARKAELSEADRREVDEACGRRLKDIKK